jgi:hypothetical protein
VQFAHRSTFLVDRNRAMSARLWIMLNATSADPTV